MESYFISFSESSKTAPPPSDTTLDSPLGPLALKELVEESVKDEQNAFIFAWVERARSRLTVQALERAVALCLRPECYNLEGLGDYNPKFSGEHLSKFIGTILKITDDTVSFANQSVTDFFVQTKPLDNLELWQSKDPEFSLARACITHLSMDDFRDLPLPVNWKGHRSDLEKSDPFLTYASKYWHHHVHLAEDAKLLEPALDKIIDPTQNNVYLWTDQSSGSAGTGPREFFRSRSEVAIKRDIPWLALYLLDTASAEPEDIFPARDLKLITRKAPRTLKVLVQRKPQYYLPAVTKDVLMEAAGLYRGALETLQLILPAYENLHLPATFLAGVARNDQGDRILEFLFSKLEDLPITHRMLMFASANHRSGQKILEMFFRRNPSIRVDSWMINGAIFAWNNENLRLLLEHDPHAPVTEDTLVSAVRMAGDGPKFQLLLGASRNIQISSDSKVIETAVKLNRSSMVKLIFDTYKDLKVTDQVIKIAAGSDGHQIDMAEYLLDRCDLTIITEDVLLSAVRRLNSPDKMTALLLRYSKDIEITDQMLIASSKSDWSGKTLDVLLERRGGQEVPKEVVDQAVEVKKRQLSYTWRDTNKNYPDLLQSLQERVPDDPYLKKTLEETDFSPPPPPDPESARTKVPPSAVPDAASNSNIAAVRQFLDQGADVDAQFGSCCPCDRNKGSGTALQRAAKQRDIEMVKLLLESSANPDLQDGDYGNPLQEASMVGDLGIVKLLVEHKAQLNLQGGRYGSPLIAAIRADDVKIAQFLLESGADINFADDRHGWTPYLHAVAYECYDVARFLRDTDSSLAAVGELIALPPGRFVKTRDNSTVTISEDGLAVSTDTSDASELGQRIQVRGDHPIVPTLPFYFEMTVVRAGGGGIIGIGFGEESSCYTGMPGHNEKSWGYHGDDGHDFEESDHHLVPLNPTYGAGDVVGCGVDFASKTAFFTKNGARLGTTFYMVTGELYPVIGLGDQGTEVKVNFGETDFVYQW